jgi:hypothetical protein|tara:strand:+ start:114 stop:296 length:183 start_codon:yes stop_codon:yes gene_type:complete
MKNVKTFVLNQPKVRIVKNTDRNDRDQWAKIVVNGTVMHTGQPKYIKGLAKKKYNLLANF